MSNDAASKKNEPKNETTKPGELPAPFEAPAEFVSLSTNALVYKPDLCKTHPVQGYLLGRVMMPPVGGDREWECLVLRTTKPTIGCDRDDNVLPVKAGDEIRIPVTHQLQQDAKIAGIAGSTHWTAELFLKPKEKISIGGGKTMWTYDARMSPKVRERTQEEKMYNLDRVQGMAAGQLPAANGAATASPPPPF